MDVIIYLVEGSEKLPKTRVTIERSTNFTNAADALLGLVPIPAGWRFRILTPGYAVYLAPDDTTVYCHAVIAIQAPIYTDLLF